MEGKDGGDFGRCMMDFSNSGDIIRLAGIPQEVGGAPSLAASTSRETCLRYHTLAHGWVPEQNPDAIIYDVMTGSPPPAVIAMTLPG